MIQFFQTYFLYIVLILGLCFLGGLAFFLKQQRIKREWKELSQRKRRDEALNEALRNPQLENNSEHPDGPMEIRWEEKAVNEKKKRDASQMVELVLLSEYSHRKYIYRLDQPIRIGSGNDNHMQLQWEDIVPQHCEIFPNDGKACIRCLSGAQGQLKRGKVVAEVGDKGIYLNNGDRIRLGKAEIQFRQIKT